MWSDIPESDFGFICLLILSSCVSVFVFGFFRCSI